MGKTNQQIAQENMKAAALTDNEDLAGFYFRQAWTHCPKTALSALKTSKK